MQDTQLGRAIWAPGYRRDRWHYDDLYINLNAIGFFTGQVVQSSIIVMISCVAFFGLIGFCDPPLRVAFISGITIPISMFPNTTVEQQLTSLKSVIVSGSGLIEHRWLQRLTLAALLLWLQSSMWLTVAFIAARRCELWAETLVNHRVGELLVHRNPVMNRNSISARWAALLRCVVWFIVVQGLHLLLFWRLRAFPEALEWCFVFLEVLIFISMFEVAYVALECVTIRMDMI